MSAPKPAISSSLISPAGEYINYTARKSFENIGERISPYGGELVNLLVQGEERRELAEHANKLSSLQLSPRSLCHLELLSIRAFSPLDRFMGKADYMAVLEEMRLATGRHAMNAAVRCGKIVLLKFSWILRSKFANSEISRVCTPDDDPYEEPLDPEIRLNTIGCSPEYNAHQIINYLLKRSLMQAGIASCS